MFNFFKYKNGKNIPFRNIRYRDIQNFLNDDWEEGYTIEFKEVFNDSVKKKIPSIFTSFANCEGGLLLIGIKDGTKIITDIPKPKGEIYAVLSQIIENKITPISPKFYAKFIENPSKKGFGIVAVYVEEGIMPPYIANGTIYVREASRKVPIYPERPTVDYLYKKREQSSNLLLMSKVNDELTQALNIKKFTYYTDGQKELNKLKDKIDILVTKIKSYDLSVFKEVEKFTKSSKLYSTLAVLSGPTTSASEFFNSQFERCKECLKCVDIPYDDEFFNLEGLQVNDNILQGWSYDSEDARSEKCKNILELRKLLETYIFSSVTLRNFENCYEHCFVINNLGGKFDEDILLTIKFPKHSILNLSKPELFNEDSNSFNNKIISYITNKPVSDIEDYDNYTIIPFSLMPPAKGISLELDYDDKGYLFEKFLNDLDNIYQYDFYQSDDFDIIKVKFNKILPKQKIYLPCKIIAKQEVKQISYEIISKYSTIKSSGDLIVT